ncbi:non-specific serine/threonine protein kinase [Malassezia caprae]|uniref:non-specific serine/threonine protein kinase n=1 Tax=Malassezia caprae TaxID=1381934 RepID=A0AAF0IU65_9BASI|nr:non-specific serine/threonine protein kinase [Malassezia caprae]
MNLDDTSVSVRLPVPDLPRVATSSPTPLENVAQESNDAQEESHSGSSDVERTKSVSSVSSANSTSSIEAAPFRAPPRGNMRTPHLPSATPSPSTLRPVDLAVPLEAPPAWGDSGLGSSSLAPNPAWSGPMPPQPPLLRLEDTMDMPKTVMERTEERPEMLDAVRLRSVSPSPMSSSRARHMPKSTNDRWMYRNGPGQTRRLPMLGPVVSHDDRLTHRPPSLRDEEMRRHIPRPSSRTSLRLPENIHYRPGSVEPHLPSPDTPVMRLNQVDEDARSHLSSSSISTLAPKLSFEPVQMENSSSSSALRDTSPHARTLHWLADMRRQSSAGDDEEPRISHVHRGSVSTLVPRSPSPTGPSQDALSLPNTPRAKTTSLPPPMDERRTSRNSTSTISESGRLRRRTVQDFVFGEVLGEGSYSTVLKAWDVHDLPESERACLVNHANVLAAEAGQTASLTFGNMPKVYAVKVLDKVHILKEKKQKYVRVEKEALSLLVQTPGVITLYHTFQDRESLYFVLELAPNCELLHYVKTLGSLDWTSATYYGAQLANVIERIHCAGVVHRDLKPENILLGEDMRIRVTDFGSARVLGRQADGTSAEKAHSFVGTADYVSPELLNDECVGMPADWWALGCILFKMLTGVAPFRAANEYQTFQKIIHRSFTFPEPLPTEAREVIDALLCLDPVRRASAKEVRSSAMFRHVDFASLWTLPPPPLRTGLFARPASQAVPAEQELNLAMEEMGLSRDGSLVSQDKSIPTGDEASVSSDAGGSHQRSAGGDVRPTPSRSNSTSSKVVQRGEVTLSDILLPTEDIVFSSPMLLRRVQATGMFARKCQMYLTTMPRLLCTRERNRSVQVLADVPLSWSSAPVATDSDMKPPLLRQSSLGPMQAITRTLGMRKSESDPNDNAGASEPDRPSETAIDAWPVDVELRGARAFFLQTPTKQYLFEDPAGDAPFWVQSIHETLQMHASNSASWPRGPSDVVPNSLSPPEHAL